MSLNRVHADSIITQNVTLNVTVSGSDSTGTGSVDAPFASVRGALDWLNTKIIGNTVIVTIQMGAGDFNFPWCTILNHPYSKQIELHGAPLTGAKLTGIHEANFTDPTTPTVGARASTELYNTAGQFANTVTDPTTRQAARDLDTTNNIALLKSRFATRWTTTGGFTALALRAPMRYIGKILFIGDGTVQDTTQPETAGYGVVVLDGSSANLEEMGVANFGGHGILVSGRAAIGSYLGDNQPPLYIVGCGEAGLVIFPASSCNLSNVYIQGCKTYGLLVSTGRSLIKWLISSGCGSSGIAAADTGVLILTHAHSSGHGNSGVLLTRGGRMQINAGTVDDDFMSVGNTNSGFIVQGGASINSNALAGADIITDAPDAIAAVSLSQNAFISTTIGLNVTRAGTGILSASGSRMNIQGGLSISRAITTALSATGQSSIYIKDAFTLGTPLPSGNIAYAIYLSRITSDHSSLKALATANPTKFSPTFGTADASDAKIYGP